MKANAAALMLMLIAVPFAGEIKFYPFDDQFRISLGIAVFFFFLLWIQHVPPAISGLLVGIDVVAFRMIWGRIGQTGISFEELFQVHSPSFFYYLTYAILFQLMKLNHAPYRPLRVGVLSIIIEIISSFVELYVRHSSALETLDGLALAKVFMVAIVRCFFVLGFFNMIQLRHSILKEEQQREQNEHNLVLISNLYEESFQLKKTLQYAEDITRDCYELYRSLQSADSAQKMEQLAQRALKISGQVHEIKKDNQRIFAGLSKLITDQSSLDYMDLEEIGHLVVGTNQKYASSLSKQIQFNLEVHAALPPLHAYTILSLINNLVANAVEAIQDTGIIHIRARQLQDSLEFRVSDNGPGIPLKNRERIFTPGYTSKYDQTGAPSTGMGLSYIQGVLQDLHGQMDLQLEEDTGLTVFIIRLPIKKLVLESAETTSFVENNPN